MKNNEIYLSLPKWNIEELTGYKPKTTFWQDFSIADNYGNNAISDTFQRAFNAWKFDVVYLTELVLVLNHKCWQWYDDKDLERSQLYQKYFEEARDFAWDNLKGEDLEYFYTTTD